MHIKNCTEIAGSMGARARRCNSSSRSNDTIYLAQSEPCTHTIHLITICDFFLLILPFGYLCRAQTRASAVCGHVSVSSDHGMCSLLANTERERERVGNRMTDRVIFSAAHTVGEKRMHNCDGILNELQTNGNGSY